MSKIDDLRAALEATEKTAAQMRADLTQLETEARARVGGATASGTRWGVALMPHSPGKRSHSSLADRYVIGMGDVYDVTVLVVEDLQAMLVALDASEADSATAEHLRKLGPGRDSIMWPENEIPF